MEHLQKLMEESNLSTSGHVLFAHYQQGMTDYLAIALLHHSEGVAVNESLEVSPSRHLDFGQLYLAARINISEWRNNKQSMQYISFIKGKGGKKVTDYFREGDLIGREVAVACKVARQAREHEGHGASLSLRGMAQACA